MNPISSIVPFPTIRQLLKIGEVEKLSHLLVTYNLHKISVPKLLQLDNIFMFSLSLKIKWHVFFHGTH